MFKPDPDGRLHPVVDTSGEFTEASAGAIATDLAAIETLQGAISATLVTVSDFLQLINEHGPPTFEQTATTLADAVKAKRRFAFTEITLSAGGEATDQRLVMAHAGYYCLMEIVGIISDQSDANTVFTFIDEDNNPLEGAPFPITLNLVANTFNTQLKDLTVRVAGGSTNKDIDVDISAGAANAVIIVVHKYWEE